MNNIEILEEYFNKICFDETNKITADLCTIGINEIQDIENEIQENKELKEENNRIKSLDYTALAEEMEMGLWMPRADVEEYYIPIERLNDYIDKSKLKEIIYPTPENPISFEVQSSEMYKKLEKLVEGE